MDDDGRRIHPSTRTDPWRSAIDHLDSLRARMLEIEHPERDTIARRLMAEVALDRTTSFIVLLRANGEVLDANPAALHAGGLDRSEVVGARLWRTPWWQASPRTQEQTERALEAVVAMGRLARFDVDLWIEAAGSARGTLDLSLRPLRGRDGRVDLVLADGRSVTDRKRAERRITRQHAEVRVLNDRLALVNEYHERLIGNISHDLRMPLQTLIARSDRVLQLAGDPAVRVEARAMRLAASQALAQLETMLEQARRGDAEDRLHPAQGDLAATVRDVVDQFTPLACERSLDLRVSTPDVLDAAYDAERVSRVVANLLANAVRFAPEGGVVRVSLTVHGSLAHLEVADSGPGIPPEEREELFERFGTGRHERSGTGLGLAIVHEFVLLHGGTVSVDAAPEGGAVFIVTLPLDIPGSTRPATLAQRVAGARQAELARTSLEALLEPGVQLPGATLPSVLIVDGGDERVAGIAAAFERRAVLSSAAGSREALALAQELEPDLIVVGAPLGDPKGAALVRQLVDTRHANGRIVVGLAEPDSPTAEQLSAAGAHDVLADAELPERAGDLIARVRAAPPGATPR